MSDEMNLQLEYRRRRTRVIKGIVVLGLLPFALMALLWYVGVPAMFISGGMAATLLGIFVCVLYVLRIWKCPACGKSLSPGTGGGTLGGKCVACNAELYAPRRSKDGSRIYQ